MKIPEFRNVSLKVTFELFGEMVTEVLEPSPYLGHKVWYKAHRYYAIPGSSTVEVWGECQDVILAEYVEDIAGDTCADYSD